MNEIKKKALIGNSHHNGNNHQQKCLKIKF